jgi:hypothetical protein
MMKKTRTLRFFCHICLAALIWLLPFGRTTLAATVLIDDGKAMCSIILPAAADAEEKKAAKILQNVFRQMTGVAPQIKNEPTQVTGHAFPCHRY